jgi:SPP1 gp7 family putative phage head morphogenesis protein
MLESEAALLLALRRNVETVRTGAAESIQAAARELQWRLNNVYLAGRRSTAGMAAYEMADDVIRLIASEVGAGQIVPATARGLSPEIKALIGDYADIEASHTATGMDSWRARRAARGYVNHWVDDAARLGADDAFTAQEWRLRMGAATESADAWGLAREDVLDNFAARNPHLTQFLFRVWDATMDRRTCPTCSSAHGTIVRVDEPFPAGRPGGVHPNCRCTEQVLTYDEIDLDYYGGELAA